MIEVGLTKLAHQKAIASVICKRKMTVVPKKKERHTAVKLL